MTAIRKHVFTNACNAFSKQVPQDLLDSMWSHLRSAPRTQHAHTDSIQFRNFVARPVHLSANPLAIDGAQ